MTTQQAGQSPTYRELLRSITGRLSKAGVPEPSNDARLLIRHAAGVSAEKLISSLADPVPPTAIDALEGVVRRRENREPLQYITGRAGFFGREFNVDTRVLIPRPETEQIVEQVLDFARRRGSPPRRIADIGTGSGILAITLALELPGAEVWATDISRDSLDLARENASILGANTDFIEGDLFAPLNGDFDVIVSNPPYIRTPVLAGLEPELAWEPRGALDGGQDGLDVIRPLLAALEAFLAKSASIAIIEIDPPIASESTRLAKASVSGARVDVLTDLAGLERILLIERN